MSKADCEILVYPVIRNNEEGETQYGLLKTLMHTTYADVLKRFDATVRWRDAARVFSFSLENYRWGSSNPDIQALDEMRYQLHRDFDFCVEYVRVGEDEGDIESEYSGDAQYMIYPVTHIAVDITNIKE